MHTRRVLLPRHPHLSISRTKLLASALLVMLTAYFILMASSRAGVYPLSADYASIVFAAVLVASVVVGAWVAQWRILVAPIAAVVLIVVLARLAESGAIPEVFVGSGGQVGLLVAFVLVVQAGCVSIGCAAGLYLRRKRQ